MKSESSRNKIWFDLKMVTKKQINDETQVCINNIGHIQIILQKQGEVGTASFGLNCTRNQNFL